jgi:hypothetical protein
MSKNSKTPSISKIPNTKEFQSNRSLVYKAGAHVQPEPKAPKQATEETQPKEPVVILRNKYGHPLPGQVSLRRAKIYKRSLTLKELRAQLSYHSPRIIRLIRDCLEEDLSNAPLAQKQHQMKVVSKSSTSWSANPKQRLKAQASRSMS